MARIALISIYASDFRLLACDINWNKEALMSQFHWGLRDDVKDLLLFMPNPQTLNEAIIQAVKCDNWLSQRRQDQRFNVVMINVLGTHQNTVIHTLLLQQLFQVYILE
jgi:hypothetical protein